MNEEVIFNLTNKDDAIAYKQMQEILSESEKSGKWISCLDEIAGLLDHPKSYVRNRAFCILSVLIRWDEENRFDWILDRYLEHITDEKPISCRICIQELANLGKNKPQYISRIRNALQTADLSGYKDSMRPLIERDIENTIRILTETDEE